MTISLFGLSHTADACDDFLPCHCLGVLGGFFKMQRYEDPECFILLRIAIFSKNLFEERNDLTSSQTYIS